MPSAANRNFNKNVTGWFMDAFNILKPSDEELISLQDELMAGLASVQSKAVNTVLAHLKKIVPDPEFKTSEFSHFLPNLLSSEVKNRCCSQSGSYRKDFSEKENRYRKPENGFECSICKQR